jgi:hypothetical protein
MTSLAKSPTSVRPNQEAIDRLADFKEWENDLDALLERHLEKLDPLLLEHWRYIGRLSRRDAVKYARDAAKQFILQDAISAQDAQKMREEAQDR